MEDFMTYALISDIHGNMPALQAVLDDARKNNNMCVDSITDFIFVDNVITPSDIILKYGVDNLDG